MESVILKEESGSALHLLHKESCNTCWAVRHEAYMMIIQTIHLNSHAIQEYILNFLFNRCESHLLNMIHAT